MSAKRQDEALARQAPKRDRRRWPRAVQANNEAAPSLAPALVPLLFSTLEARPWKSRQTITACGMKEAIFSSTAHAACQAGAPITALATSVLASNPASITLNLWDLHFLNSSGINLLAKFTIEVRKHPDVRLVVRGTPDIPWKSKSLPNLKKLHPALVLLMD